MKLNAEDGGNHKFIMAQLHEVCDEKSEAAKAGYRTICEIGEERIRRAGEKVREEVEAANAQLKLGEEPGRVPDNGFRVLKIDSSNFEDVYATPEDASQQALFNLADNLKPDRTSAGLLFEALPAFQVPFSATIERIDAAGFSAFDVDGARSSPASTRASPTTPPPSWPSGSRATASCATPALRTPPRPPTSSRSSRP